NENPVFYVQYAHARICTMLNQAEAKGITLTDEYDATLLTSDKEQDLLKQVAEFPSVIADAAEKEAPYRITQYVYDLATMLDRKSTRLNSSHVSISYAVFCLKKKSIFLSSSTLLDIYYN